MQASSQFHKAAAPLLNVKACKVEAHGPTLPLCVALTLASGPQQLRVLMTPQEAINLATTLLYSLKFPGVVTLDDLS